MKQVLLEITRLAIGQTIIVDKVALDTKDARVRQLRKIERAFKRAYNIDTEVLYVDSKDKLLIKNKKNKGYYHNIRKHIVIFLTNDIEANTKTLLHELTHAYQAKYMTTKYKASKNELVNGEVTYRNAWHERHARSSAAKLMDMDFTRNIAKIPAYKVA